MDAKVLHKEQLAKKLAALPAAAKEQIRDALVRSAREITDLMISLAPRDTGRLQVSIGFTFGVAPKGTISFGDVKFGDLKVTIYAGDDEAFYARWVEFGTQKTRAQPYFFPAYRALRKPSKARVSRAMNKAARQVASGG